VKLRAAAGVEVGGVAKNLRMALIPDFFKMSFGLGNSDLTMV
jgi:hypothetical protein